MVAQSRGVQCKSDKRGRRACHAQLAPDERHTLSDYRLGGLETPALEVDLVLAVQSLYSDGLRPYGRLVRKRLGEIASERGEAFCDGDLGRLRRFCELSHCLTVQPGEGSEWSVVLPNQHADFVDVYSTHDGYSDAIWVALSQHLCFLESQEDSLPGGRYSCAKALMAARLPALRGLSLGKVCHIVQLAMSQKKLLGYLDGTIAPYNRSSSRMKDTAAELCVGSSASQQLPLASASDARSCMIDVLESAVRKGKKHVPISTLKRLFRSRFHKELSETALGYTKLSDLLQDGNFKDFCSVRLLERGYVVIPNDTFSAAHARSHNGTGRTPMRSSATLPTLSFCAPIMTTCKNTFIHAPEPQPASLARSKSVPKNLGSCKMSCEEVDDSDESTNVSSGVQSPAVTASPCWTPRDSSERPWEWVTEGDCNSYNSHIQMGAWADVPLDGSCISFYELSHPERLPCSPVSESMGSYFAGPCESSDPANRCVLCLSHFI